MTVQSLRMSKTTRVVGVYSVRRSFRPRTVHSWARVALSVIIGLLARPKHDRLGQLSRVSNPWPFSILLPVNIKVYSILTFRSPPTSESVSPQFRSSIHLSYLSWVRRVSVLSGRLKVVIPTTSLLETEASS